MGRINQVPKEDGVRAGWGTVILEKWRLIKVDVCELMMSNRKECACFEAEAEVALKKSPRKKGADAVRCETTKSLSKSTR